MERRDIPSNDNWVFLLGAGFSSPYDCPVMDGFMEQARRLYFTRKQDRPDNELVECHQCLLEFQAKCLKGAWAFNRNWENIEELYTQADLLRLAGKENAADLCNKIAWSIWDVYRNPKVTEELLIPITGSLVHWGLRPVFITTNYDTCIERQLPNPNSYYYPGLTYDDREGLFKEQKSAATLPARFPLIKLHGSVNWFQLGNHANGWVGINSRIERDHRLGHDQANHDLNRFKEVLLSLWPSVTERTKDRITPAIIPPMLGKASLSPVIETQWRKAIEVLSLARQIWIIGYSFPPTDTFMLRLLSAGIEENPNLQKIVIVDWGLYPDWKDRLTRMFSPMTLNHRVEFCSADSSEVIRHLAGLTQRTNPTDWLASVRACVSDQHVTNRRREMQLKFPTLSELL